ncbi:MAG: energy transducer TonB, partial [Woeseiaceae bacterium]
KVSPTYPSIAIARGLEGSVLVQYDVTTEGQVANVVVLESTHSLFNKAAIAAAYRFKYKPRTVDGVPYETEGLKNLFRFEMED